MIELNNLTKIYHTEKEGSIALQNLTIKFPERGFVAITGESGSGKTTLLNILSGFIPYEEGSFFIDGKDTLTFSEDDFLEYRKRDVGFIFQNYSLIENFSVLDNLTSVLLILGYKEKEAKKEALKYLEIVGLLDKQNQKAFDLSSGQKQCLSIARALIKHPKIILADEPTANLDPENSIKVMKLLAQFSKDALVIVSTHNYEDAAGYANQFVRLYKGKLTAHEIISEPNKNEVTEIVAKKENTLGINHLNLKNQTFRLIKNVLFMTIMSLLLIVVLSVFVSNIDEAKTKVLSYKTFNNINQNEIVFMRQDRNAISREEFDNIKDIKHVVSKEYYGLASEFNYFYRKDIDYSSNTVIAKTAGIDGIEYTFEQVEFISYKLYVKSYANFITEKDLKAGVLPTKYNEVVAYGDYEVGDTIRVYFNERVLQGNAKFNLEFVVSGVLKNKSDDLYFSTDFLRGLDFIQSRAKATIATATYYYYLANAPKIDLNYRGTYQKLVPICDINLNDDEIAINSTLMAELQARLRGANIESISFNVYANSQYYFDQIKKIQNYEYIDPSMVYVPYSVYETYIDGYPVTTCRLYIDNYAFVDDVIVAMNNLGYDCLSEYRASSIEYDSQKQIERAVLLIVSFILFIVFNLFYFLFNYLLQNDKKKDYITLNLLGLRNKKARLVYGLELLISTTIAFVLAFIIYRILVLSNISYVVETAIYLRVYHYLLIFILLIADTFLIIFKYYSFLKKNMVKGW